MSYTVAAIVGTEKEKVEKLKKELIQSVIILIIIYVIVNWSLLKKRGFFIYKKYKKYIKKFALSYFLDTITIYLINNIKKMPIKLINTQKKSTELNTDTSFKQICKTLDERKNTFESSWRKGDTIENTWKKFMDRDNTFLTEK